MPPTKILVFSDVHADPAAGAAVLALGTELGAESWVCLGDVVGYGDAPIETVRLLRDSGGAVLRGNHDAAVNDDRLLASFSGEAKSGVRRHRQLLTAPDREWLAKLPLEHRVGRLRFTHASLPEPELFRYMTDSRKAELLEPENLVHFATVVNALEAGEILFVGHSHRPFIWEERAGGWRQEFPSRVTYRLPAGERRMVVEVGSISLPRRGRPTAVLVDLEREQLSFHRMKPLDGGERS